MKHGLKKAWLWSKLILLILIIIWISLFFAFNSGNRVDVWLFPFVSQMQNVSLSLIIPITAAVSILVFLLAGKVTKLLREMNKLREQEQAEHREKRMDELAREMERKLSSSKPSPRAESDEDQDSAN